MPEQERVGEVIESCTTDFTAQCYELYQSPALGKLVKAHWEPQADLFGVVCRAATAGIDTGRRPIARGKDEADEEEIFRSSPQLLKLLRSEFQVAVIGFKKGEAICQYLPPQPARLHSFVHLCNNEEVLAFSRSFDFLNILLKSRLELPVEEMVGAALRQMSLVYGAQKHAFLVSAGKELASLLSRDYSQLKAILRGLKNDAI
jgi:hypothetical protein